MPRPKLPAFFSKLPKRTLAIFLALVVVAGAGGFAYYRMAYLPAQRTEEPGLQTATVRSGDLVIYASGTGSLVPAAEASFGFGDSGQVTKINVKVGDSVQAGQLLAELDNSTQQIQYDQAKRALAELTSPYAIATAEQDIATALQNVDSARSHLAYLISPAVLYSEEQAAKAQQDLAAAQVAAQASPSAEADQKVKQAQDALNTYLNALKGNQSYYENNYLPANFTKVDRQTHTRYVAAPTDVDIAEARANYAQAQAIVIEAQNYLAA